jgi:hypothetical protein
LTEGAGEESRLPPENCRHNATNRRKAMPIKELRLAMHFCQAETWRSPCQCSALRRGASENYPQHCRNAGGLASHGLRENVAAWRQIWGGWRARCGRRKLKFCNLTAAPPTAQLVDAPLPRRISSGVTHYGVFTKSGL